MREWMRKVERIKVVRRGGKCKTVENKRVGKGVKDGCIDGNWHQERQAAFCKSLRSAASSRSGGCFVNTNWSSEMSALVSHDPDTLSVTFQREKELKRNI